MVQIYEKTELEENDIVVVIPDKEEIKIEVKQKPKKKLFKKYSKFHKNQIDINKLKNKINANIYRGGLIPR